MQQNFVFKEFRNKEINIMKIHGVQSIRRMTCNFVSTLFFDLK